MRRKIRWHSCLLRNYRQISYRSNTLKFSGCLRGMVIRTLGQIPTPLFHVTDGGILVTVDAAQSLSLVDPLFVLHEKLGLVDLHQNKIMLFHCSGFIVQSGSHRFDVIEQSRDVTESPGYTHARAVSCLLVEPIPCPLRVLEFDCQVLGET